MKTSIYSLGFGLTLMTAAGLTLAACDSSTAPGGTKQSTSSPGPIDTNNWYTQNNYWQRTFSTRPYYQPGTPYSIYQSAYQFGFNAYNQYGRNKPYNQVQAQLQTTWNTRMSPYSTLSWSQAEPAVQEAYNRMYNNQGAPPLDSEDTTAGAGIMGKNPFNSGAAAGTTLGR